MGTIRHFIESGPSESFATFFGPIGSLFSSKYYSGVAAFATKQVSEFAKTPLPSQMVYLFSVSLPFAEALIGVLIFVWLWSRFAYCAGFLLIINLTFGSTLAFREHKGNSVDGARGKSPEASR